MRWRRRTAYALSEGVIQRDREREREQRERARTRRGRSPRTRRRTHLDVVAQYLVRQFVRALISERAVLLNVPFESHAMREHPEAVPHVLFELDRGGALYVRRRAVDEARA